METQDVKIESFVIKIYLDEMGDLDQEPSWRGHITHVLSRRRVYLDNLGQIIRFIIPYLEDSGIESEQEQA